MNGKIKLTQKDIKNIVSIILEQESEDEWVKISPERYTEIMKYAGYNSVGVSRIPEFRGKKIWITGNLNLSNTPTKSLDAVFYIDGSLDIRNTQISNINNIKTKGPVWDSGTPIEAKRRAEVKRKKLADSEERRQNDEWNIKEYPNDKEAWAAQAIFEYLRDDEKVEVKTQDDVKRVVELKELLDNLEQKRKERDEKGEDTTDVILDIEVAEDELNDLNEKIDVYNLIPSTYDHYGLPMFEVISNEDHDGYEYCAGTPSQMEYAALEYAKNMVDEGIEGFNKHFIRQHIDGEKVADYFRDFYENDVRESPDSYFDDSDYKLTDEQEKRIEEIDALIDVLNNRLEEIENEIEEPSEYRKAYDEIQNRIDVLESEKEDIEPEVGEPTEEMIDDKVEELLENVENNPISYLEDFGYTDRLEDFINRDEFIQDIVDTDGVGIINSYDGEYSTVYVEGEEYYVMRLN